MLLQLTAQTSAITFDVGTTGIRACQIRAGRQRTLCDALSIDLPPRSESAPDDAQEPSGREESRRLARVIGQGRFRGREVGLVLGPPQVHFHALRVPENALSRAPEQVRVALAWEVARETRTEPNELEVRHWRLPPGQRQNLNVLAVAMPAARARALVEHCRECELHLKRIDVTPRALARRAVDAWKPDPNDVWGIVDLGARSTRLIMLIGDTPVYIRSIRNAGQTWTRRIAEAFEIPLAEAEQIKREQGIHATAGDSHERGAYEDFALVDQADLPRIVFHVLHEPLDSLVREINRCLAYVLQSYPDRTLSGLYLSGGGSGMPGLDAFIQVHLDLPVQRIDALDHSLATGPPQPTGRSLKSTPLPASALGGALLDLEEP